MKTTIPFVRSSSVYHSNWQSAIQKTVFSKINRGGGSATPYNSAEVIFHPMMLAGNLHVDAHLKGEAIEAIDKKILEGKTAEEMDKDPFIQAYLHRPK